MTRRLKSDQIRSFYGPYFPVFELNTEIYSVNLLGFNATQWFSWPSTLEHDVINFKTADANKFFDKQSTVYIFSYYWVKSVKLPSTLLR